MFPRIFATLMMLGILGAIAGCNTMAGAGKDIERGGAAVQDAAKSVQKKM